MTTTAPVSRFLACLIALTGWAVPDGNAGPLRDFFFPGGELQAITVTDFTAAGRQRRLPTPSEPVYYAAVSAGYRDFGGVMAGERPISREVVNKTVLKVLAQQGYLPTDANHRPEIILLWSWGTLNAEKLSSGPNGYTAHLNQSQMVSFLGGYKLGLAPAFVDPFFRETLAPGLFHFGSDAQNLLGAAEDNCYVAVIAAYDLKLRDPKHGVLLWNTRISCPARGFWLPDALPGMLAIASPYIGRDTPRPVWVRATDKYKPEVKLGDLKLLEYLESNQAPVLSAGPSN